MSVESSVERRCHVLTEVVDQSFRTAAIRNFDLPPDLIALQLAFGIWCSWQLALEGSDQAPHRCSTY